MQILGLFCAILCCILVVIGFVRDAVMATYLRELETCFDQQTGDVYGADGNTIQAVNCAVGHGQRCLCVNSEETDTCYLFEKKITDTCGDILTAMPDLLIASVVFQILLLGILLYYSVQVCIDLCCPPPPPTPYGSHTDHTGRHSHHSSQHTGRHTGRHSGHIGIDHGPNHSYRSHGRRSNNSSARVPGTPGLGPLADYYPQGDTTQNPTWEGAENPTFENRAAYIPASPGRLGPITDFYSHGEGAQDLSSEGAQDRIFIQYPPSEGVQYPPSAKYRNTEPALDV